MTVFNQLRDAHGTCEPRLLVLPAVVAFVGPLEPSESFSLQDFSNRAVRDLDLLSVDQCLLQSGASAHACLAQRE